MHRHRRDEPAGLQDRDADDAADHRGAVRLQHVTGNARVVLAVAHNIGKPRAHQPQALRPELRERVAADDAVHAVGVVAGQDKGVFVRFHLGVGAAIDLQVLPEHARRGIGDLLGIRQRPHRIVHPDQHARGRLVLHHAEHPEHVAVLGVASASAGQHPALASAGEQPVLERVVAVRGDRLFDGDARPFAVIGVEQLPQRRPGEPCAGRNAEDGGGAG